MDRYPGAVYVADGADNEPSREAGAVAAMLALTDGLKARGLLDRAQVLTVDGCSLELVPVTPNLRRTTKEVDADDAAARLAAEELTYASS